MTPLELEILIHYATSGEDYREGDFSAPAVAQALDDFQKRGILKVRNNWIPAVYEMPNELAKVILYFVSRIKLPEQEWKMDLEEPTDWRIKIT